MKKSRGEMTILVSARDFEAGIRVVEKWAARHAADLLKRNQPNVSNKVCFALAREILRCACDDLDGLPCLDAYSVCIGGMDQ